MLLVEQLERFSFPKSVKDHLIDLTLSAKQFSDVLVWLLRRDILIQFHTYVLLIVPETFGGALSVPATERLRSDEEDAESGQLEGDEEEELDAQFLPASRATLTRYELAYIASVTADDTPLDRLFARLCQYGRGRHHLEEIMWRENLTREDILSVLRDMKYAALTTVQHEDPYVVLHDCVRPTEDVL